MPHMSEGEKKEREEERAKRLMGNPDKTVPADLRNDISQRLSKACCSLCFYGNQLHQLQMFPSLLAPSINTKLPWFFVYIGNMRGGQITP